MKDKVTFKALGKSWTLKCSMNAMCLYEDRNDGNSIMEAFDAATAVDGSKSVTMKGLRELFYVLLAQTNGTFGDDGFTPDEDFTLTQVGDIMSELGFKTAFEQMLEVVKATFPQPKEKSDDGVASDSDGEAGK